MNEKAALILAAALTMLATIGGYCALVITDHTKEASGLVWVVIGLAILGGCVAS